MHFVKPTLPFSCHACSSILRPLFHPHRTEIFHPTALIHLLWLHLISSHLLEKRTTSSLSFLSSRHTFQFSPPLQLSHFCSTQQTSSIHSFISCQVYYVFESLPCNQFLVYLFKCICCGSEFLLLILCFVFAIENACRNGCFMVLCWIDWLQDSSVLEM